MLSIVMIPTVPTKDVELKVLNGSQGILPGVAAGIVAAATGLLVLLGLGGEVALGLGLGVGLGLALRAIGADETAGTTGGAGLAAGRITTAGDAPGDVPVACCTAVATAAAAMMTGCCCCMRQDCIDG